MPRTHSRIPTTARPDQVMETVRSVLTAEGFKEKIFKGAPVWKKGTGHIMAAQYIMAEMEQDTLHLTLWMRDSIGFRESPVSRIPSLPQTSLLRAVNRVQEAVANLS